MTVAMERTEMLQALVVRADRARAHALANRVAFERTMSQSRAFDTGADFPLLQDRGDTRLEASAARIRELEATVDGLLKRLESQGPIEQAKGIIMAQTRCDEDQAFEILRRASQRSNTKLRVLALELVARTASAARSQ